jgi:hypothetical protein
MALAGEAESVPRLPAKTEPDGAKKAWKRFVRQMPGFPSRFLRFFTLCLHPHEDSLQHF